MKEKGIETGPREMRGHGTPLTPPIERYNTITLHNYISEF